MAGSDASTPALESGAGALKGVSNQTSSLLDQQDQAVHRCIPCSL